MSDRPTTDLTDLRELYNFEKSTKAFLAAMEAAEPALQRLEQARCPGIGYLSNVLGEAAEKLEHLAESLEDIRLSDGSQAAWDYRFYMVRLALSLPDAAAELAGMDAAGDGVKRIEPMRRYAESIA
jgi:hypothetical protein